MLISQEYHILDLTLKFQHKGVLNWKDNVGVYHWFSAWRLLLALTIPVYQTGPTGRTWDSRNQAEGGIKLSVRGLPFR